MDKVEEYQKLKEQAETLNTQITHLQGAKEEKVKRLKAIFSKRKVNSMKELTGSFMKASEQAEQAAKELQSFIDKSGPAVRAITGDK